VKSTLIFVLTLSAAVLALSLTGRARAQSTGEGSVDERIAETLAEIERTEAQKSRVDAEIHGLGARRAAARERLTERTRALYRVTRAGMLPLAGGFSALLSHAARVDRLERMVETDVKAYSELASRGRALRATSGELTETLEEARQRLVALEQEKSRFDEVVRESSVWDDAFAMGGQGYSSGGDGSYGAFRVIDDPAFRAPSFASQRGRLAMPIAGTVDLRAANRGDGDGLEVLAQSGAAVRAAEEGRVAFAERHGAYGLMVIVDHGDSYFTMYGGLESVDLRVGDRVPRGGRMGAVGATGTLFFQVRRGTTTLEAAAWLGL
jgi:septal ring factor EnvC (AmiA/AmiB activator)